MFHHNVTDVQLESVCVAVVRGTSDVGDTDDTLQFTKMQTFYYFPEDQAKYNVSLDTVVGPMFSERYSVSMNETADGTVEFTLSIKGELRHDSQFVIV